MRSNKGHSISKAQGRGSKAHLRNTTRKSVLGPQRAEKNGLRGPMPLHPLSSASSHASRIFPDTTFVLSELWGEIRPVATLEGMLEDLQAISLSGWSGGQVFIKNLKNSALNFLKFSKYYWLFQKTLFGSSFFSVYSLFRLYCSWFPVITVFSLCLFFNF